MLSEVKVRQFLIAGTAESLVSRSGSSFKPTTFQVWRNADLKLVYYAVLMLVYCIRTTNYNGAAFVPIPPHLSSEFISKVLNG